MSTWGFNFVALKLLYPEMGPAAVSLARFALMWLALASICVIKKIPLKVSLTDWLLMLVQGFLSMGIYMICFLEGMKESTPAEGAIILGLGPIFTMLIAVLVRQEKFEPKSLLGTLLAFGGVALVVFGGNAKEHGSLVANGMVLKSAVIWAVSTVMSKPLVGKAHPLALLTLSMPGALPLLIYYGGPNVAALDWGALSLTAWSMFLYVSLIAGVAGFAFFYEGVRLVGASAAMSYQYLVSPMAVIFGMIFLRSTVTPIQVVGMVTVLGGVMLANRVRRQMNSPQTAEVTA